MSDRALHAKAETLLGRHLAAAGVGLEQLPDLPLGYALLFPGGWMKVAKVLPRNGPHPRGRKGALGIHWMLRSDVEDFVVLVDTARELVWLLPAADFRRLALPDKGRWHFDWLVVRTAASRLPDESDMDKYRIKQALERLLEKEIAMMPLEGIRVLDLTRQAPGPYCTMLLGDLGADVVIVEEPPGAGRRMDMGMSGRTQAFWALNRNKRSVALNLKETSAVEAFLKMSESADVVIEGFRPGVVKRLGVGYDAVSARNPRAIYCSLSGYGQTGPYAGLVGHDINYISIGGALGLIGTGEPGSPPAIPMNVIADFAGGGLYAAFSILAAVIARQTTGKGQYVDIAMSDGVTSLLAFPASQLFAAGMVPKPGVEMLNGGAPYYAVYECADGKWLGIGCIEPWFWSELCKALDLEDHIPNQMNREKAPEIFEALRAKFKEKTRDAWFEELRTRDICIGPIYSLDEVFEDPHVKARNMVVEIDHPEYGKVKQVGVGPKFSDTPGSVRTTGPARGAHTADLLREAGYTDAEIREMRASGAAG